MLPFYLVMKMINVQKRSEKAQKEDLIAFFRDDRFIGYGKLVDILDDELLIEEDSLMKSELEKISLGHDLWSIEID